MKKSFAVFLCVIMTVVSSFSAVGQVFAQNNNTQESNLNDRAATWDLTGVSVTEKTTYNVGDLLVIEPKVSGNTTGLKYKYVWSKNDWDTWGVTKHFSTDKAASFKLPSTGKFEFTIDATDGKSTVSKSYSVNVGTLNGAGTWDLSGVSVTKNSTYYVNDVVAIKPIVSGSTSGVKYKYVWSHNNWSTYGVTKHFSTTSAVSFKFPKAGRYDFYIDATDGKKTVTKYYTVNVSSGWANNGATLSAAPYLKSSPMKITAKTSGAMSGAKYKFVYSYENWKYWDTIGQSTSNTISFTPPRTGLCTVYIDITLGGVTKTKSISFNVNDKWTHGGVKVTQNPIYRLNAPITFQAQASGTTAGLKYKFVYSKDNWTEWKTFQGASTSNTATFTPTKMGTYDIYVDIIDAAGRTESKSTRIYVSNFGWAIADHTFSKSGPINLGESTTMKFSVGGYQNLNGMKYKFVAWNTTTDKWDVLMPFTTSTNSYTWSPTEAGNYKIYMECQDTAGNIGQRILDYKVAASSVQVGLINSNVTLAKGKTMYLKKTSVSPAGSKVSYVSQNSNVVTVDSNLGYVYGVGNGTTKVLVVDSAGRTAATCSFTVVDAEPIKFAYAAPNIAPKGSTVTMYAITDKSKSNVRFTINGQTITATNKKADGNTYVWSAGIKMSTPGTHNYTSASYGNGKWSTHSNGNATIYVSNSADSSFANSYTGARRMSDKGLQFLGECEGFDSKVYLDSGGTPTIGYGKAFFGGEHFYNNITKTEGYALMLKLVNEGSYSSYVNKLLVDNGIKFSQQQFDCLVSFSYNKGASWATAQYATRMRQLILNTPGKDLNNINKQTFADEFNKYHYMTSNGVCLQGLANRRINELEMFYQGDYVRRMPPPKTSSNSWFYYSIDKCPTLNGHKK